MTTCEFFGTFMVTCEAFGTLMVFCRRARAVPESPTAARLIAAMITVRLFIPAPSILSIPCGLYIALARGATLC